MSARPPLIVLGAGPVGLAAALEARRRGRAVEVWADRLPAWADPPSIECVPAQALALLVELGVHPGILGVDALFEGRRVQWETPQPTLVSGPRVAHLGRPGLDCALLGLAERAGVRWKAGTPVTRDALRDLDPRVAILDATGRAAVSAARCDRPRPPLVSRLFHVGGRFPEPARAFGIAAGPSGYAYRLGNAQGLVLGVVGRGEWVRAGIDAVLAGLAEVAPWMVADVPAGAVAPGRSGAASTQWAVPGARALLLGDAALARDALASQGLAAGLCDAVRAASLVSGGSESGPPKDQATLPTAHIRHVLHAVDSSPFRQSPGWREYRAFLYAVSAEPSSPVSLDQRNSNTL
ncbi:FAD-dependent oxidoreductase [Methylobacterium sp. SyP6R]|uniref:FAD-dependent oxidoreductase n=1 Tax=Methylobacterium sp. SyP6R TaxID=2718876 RepID=UPI001F1A3D06|nr:hypothetical protein [Methylobacterium sp. SyP6R]MCF4130016.1 hypothetical protein [Methylobacterium sp. SyP6R]